MTHHVPEPIAIIGSGCRFPGESVSPSKLWELLHKPRDVLSNLSERFSTEGFYHPNSAHHGTSNIQHSYLLAEDHRTFDAQFFNVKPVEADGIDPQQRLLLEVVYEAMEAGGQKLHKLQGSNTAVYVGVMSADYADLQVRDLDSIPTYFSTGNSRSILSNRVSYFFDWHGPCMTIDTACSSSLVALDSAVQALLSGTSSVAVAAGTNLCLGPEQYIAESKLKMLSPTGRCSMWSAEANGYARGEGIAAVVLKTLSKALADGDHIESIIRATGVNQDGRTKGITMPSRTAQATLIHETYQKIGLNPLKEADRCQYFEAHGTGTPAGDPIEAGAIAKAFFGTGRRPQDEKLYVGSVKTVIGHTEGTAGLAGLLKASMALQHGIIPPNMHFNSLSDSVKPFYKYLQIATSAQNWPSLQNGQPRRASVNSFGFGGTNAHAILESYEVVKADTSTSNVLPFVFSANSHSSLVEYLTRFSKFLKNTDHVDLRNLAFTLNRRSVFPFKAAFAASNIKSLYDQLDAKLEEFSLRPEAGLGTRSQLKSTRILGVFTGQGAQWASMAKGLITSSESASARIDALEASLSTLPSQDKPSWSLRAELLADAKTSRIGLAAFSQPLCTAIQVILVDQLRAAGVQFEAVVGHSSGEIGAAYCAGFVSGEDAIRIAYFRGVYAALANGGDGVSGAMMAVGTSLEDARELCELEEFEGRIGIAACNSSSSLTLSGDAEAIHAAKEVLDEEKKFARLLKVEVAYHSHHMRPCAAPYVSALNRCGITILEPPADAPSWFSSVSGGDLMTSSADLRDTYWRDNMVNAVLFSQAVEASITSQGPFDMAVEVGPHPALQGPASQILQETSGVKTPYSGVLKRGKDDVVMFSEALGAIWESLGDSAINMEAYDASEQSTSTPSLLKGLPSYAWDHDRIYWNESRISEGFRTRPEPPHELLGSRTNDNDENEFRWRNILQPKEIAWIDGHRLQDQMVLPGAAYIVMALEAATKISADASIQNIDVCDMTIDRPLVFDDENTQVEIVFSVNSIRQSKTGWSAPFSCSAAVKKGSTLLSKVVGGRLEITYGESGPDVLPTRPQEIPNLFDIEVDAFYSDLTQLGYNYSGAFRSLASAKRKLGLSVGSISNPCSGNTRPQMDLLIHPGLIDVGFQSIFLAHSAPNDGGLYSLHIPNLIKRVRVNPFLCRQFCEQAVDLPFVSSASGTETSAIEGDVSIYSEDGINALVQIEGCVVVPFSPPKAADDRLIFSKFVWGANTPSTTYVDGSRARTPEAALCQLMTQISHVYPHTNILELGSGSDNTVKLITQALGTAFASYTYSESSSSQLESVKDDVKRQSKKAAVKLLDINEDLVGQEVLKNSYDIVLSRGTLSESLDKTRALTNVHNLLRPGGFLIMLETSSWSKEQWNKASKQSGFFGAEPILAANDGSLILCQAADSRTKMLRRPLTSKLVIPDLVIVGGKTIFVDNLIDDVVDLLSLQCDNIKLVSSVEELHDANVPPMSSILVLSDLDEPIFKNFTAEKLDNMKALFDRSRNILWVTNGCMANEPYSNMIVGLGRTVKAEMPHLRLQFLDLDPTIATEPKCIAETFLKHYISDTLEQNGQLEDLLWYREPELAIRDGQIQVPRIILDSKMNDRSNSSRRAIKQDLDLDEAVATLKNVNGSFVLHEDVLAKDDTTVSIKVQQASVRAIVTPVGSVFLVLGTVMTTGQFVLAASQKCSSTVNVPKGWLVSCEVLSRDKEGLLAHFLVNVIVDHMISHPDRTILIHEAQAPLQAALKRATDNAGSIRFSRTGTTSAATDDIVIHPFASEKSIKSSLPRNLDIFIDCSAGDKKVQHSLDSHVTQKPLSSFFTADSRADTKISLSDFLHRLVLNHSAQASKLPLDHSLTVTDVLNTQQPDLLATVAWDAQSKVDVNIQPVSQSIRFNGQATYVLFGLSGELGKSLAYWMAERGASHFVLTSRKPAVDDVWMKTMDDLGVEVRVMANDVSKREDVYALATEVRQTMPPIAGVVNGAMILVDGPFMNMTIDSFEKGMRAKVDGTTYLDEVFSDNSLDFFVSLCSIANAVGNSGQTVYGAANNFMTALTAQRRQRGLAASVIDIGPLIGIGYLSRLSLTSVLEHLYKSGFLLCSEREFHTMFAEAVIASPPDSGLSHEILTGIRVLSSDEEIRSPWFSDPRMQHFIRQPEGIEGVAGSTKSKSSVKVQLSKAANMDQVTSIIQDALVNQLQTMLKLSVGGAAEQNSLLGMHADELGIDSLVAVELRSWFLGELLIDLPVLKILGGATMRELMEDAVSRIPKDMLTAVNAADSTPAPAPASTLAPVPAPLPVATHKPVAAQALSASEALPSSPVKSVRTESSKHESDELDEQSEIDTPSIQQEQPLTQVGDLFKTKKIHSSASSDSGFESETPLATPDSELSLTPPTPQSPTISSLKVSVQNKSTLVRLPGIVKPMSSGQKRFWFLHKFLEDRSTSNVVVSYRMKGAVRSHDLATAIESIGQRHEALRTRFFENQKGEPMQEIMPHTPLMLEQKHISSEVAANNEFVAMKNYEYDLDSGNTMRILLLTVTPTSHVLLIGYNHINMDGASLQILLSNIDDAYTGKPLLANICQYSTFAERRRAEFDDGKLKQEIAFWRKEFPTLPQPLPLFPMSHRGTRQALTAYDIEHIAQPIDAELDASVKDACRRYKVSPFHFYLSILRVMLVRFLDIDDICIGISDANRLDSDVLGSVGMFLNLLPLRFQAKRVQSFGESLKETKLKAYSALSNSRLPFELLLEQLDVPRSNSHTPLFQVLMDYRFGTGEKHPLGDAQIELIDGESGRTGYDLVLDIIDNARGHGYVMFKLQKGLYTQDAAELISKTFMHLVRTFAENPNLRVDRPQLFDSEATSSAVAIGDGPKLVQNWGHTVAHQIARISNQFRSKTAVVDGNGNSFTYHELNNKAGRIATALLNAGIHPESKVAVFQQPGADWIASMLAILNVGAVYVPLDLRHPIPRLATIVQDAKPSAILALPDTMAETEALGAHLKIIDISTLDANDIFTAPLKAHADQPAIILYTSGSTGVPKGIVLKHSNLSHQMEGLVQRFGLREERVLQQSALSFDMSVDQIIVALCTGGSLYVASREQRIDPVEIARIIHEEKITYAKATPSEFQAWIKFGGSHLKASDSWRQAWGGGEAMTHALLRDFRSLQLSQLGLFNCYGPSEITVACVKVEIDYRKIVDGAIPVGNALPNYSVYVLDDKQKPVPVGVPGEIVVGGAGVSSGYLNNERLTSEKYINNPFASTEFTSAGWTRMYRTGDKGYFSKDGLLNFLGRIDGDTQVKIRGVRIELEDIEKTIVQTAQGRIDRAIVSVRGEPAFLAAHVTLSAGQHAIEDRQLYLQQLLKRLPLAPYMIPSCITALDHMPLTAHFKIDRKAVASLPMAAQTASQEATAALTETETELKQLWEQTLPADMATIFTLEADSDFFSVGGNSLLLVRLQALILDHFGVALPLMEMFEVTKLEAMAAKIEHSATIQTLDWEKETALDISNIKNFVNTVPTSSPAMSSEGVVVLLTGATGYFGSRVLQRLVADPRIALVHCVAIREVNGQLPALSFDSPKIIKHAGDLTHDGLGMSEEMLASIAGICGLIVHCGAKRSFWDSYHLLRKVNVSSTKELVKIAAARKIPLHFISSGDDLADMQSPPSDGSDGYLASKWASERALKNATTLLDIPVTIHRYSSASKISHPTEPFMQEVVRVTNAYGKIPQADGWTGTMDFIRTRSMVSDVVEGSLAGLFTPKVNAYNIKRHQTLFKADAAQLLALLCKAVKPNLGPSPALEWMGEIKKLGFEYIIAGHNISMGKGETGEQMVSRR